MTRTTEGHVRKGWAALADGRWDSARIGFSNALEEVETPEALEGLSWAAWWQDDADTVFNARGRAYRLYKERGDRAAAARMATWLAADELDFRGAAAVANGWLRRAHRLLDDLPPGPDSGWLAFHDGYLAHGAGDMDRALDRARVAADLGRRFGVPDLEMLGLALEGGALVACGEVDEGMRSLDEATTAALEGGARIPISSAWACCFLVSACTATRDYERAFAWCDRIAEFAERFGSRYMLGFCRAEYGTVHLWSGRWAEAEAVLEASRDDFARSRPPYAGAPTVALAELRRRQGRTEEAARLLGQAGGGSGAQLCRARLALDAGEPRQAVELAERLLRQTQARRKLDRIPALEILARARIAEGELDEARSALEALREVGELTASIALHASGDFLDGVLRAAEGDHEGARTSLEDAVDAFDRSGAPFDAALARIELARSLAVLGRGEAAEHEAVAALGGLDELGATLEAGRTRALIETMRAGTGARPGNLTNRELDVIRLLAEGLTNREIASRLVLSEHTVHRHVTNILRKLSLPSRAAAAAYAVRSGLLETPRT